MPVSYLFDGNHHSEMDIQLPGGITRSITEGGTKFLGKSLEVSFKCHQICCSFFIIIDTPFFLSIQYNGIF